MLNLVLACPGLVTLLGVDAVDLQAWALRVATPGEWLEFPDILLFCAHKKLNLQVIVWAEG